MASSDFKLNVWRLHPRSVGVVKAEKTLNGTANPSGVKYCKPFTSANALGWWVFPSIDVDILWKGGRDFEFKFLQPYASTDYDIINSLIRPSDKVDIEKFCPYGQGRSKITLGEVEEGVVQLWTGCIFETPPGYCLHLRNPINFPTFQRGFRVMEGILETDWMQYDIWTNLIFEKQGEWIKIRRHEFPPLAQIIPMRRDGLSGEANEWSVDKNEIVHRNDDQANRVFEYWLNYNWKKYGLGGPVVFGGDRTKDPSAFYKMRAEAMGKGKSNMEPLPDKIKARKLPIKKKVKNRLVKKLSQQRK